MNENYLSISEAARKSPGKPSPSAVWRWARTGIKARNGTRVRLSHVRAGGRVLIPETALDEYFDARPDASRPVGATPPRSESRREKDIARAERDLQKAGV